MFKSLLNLFRKKAKPAGYKVDLGNGDFVLATTAEQAAEFAYIIQRNKETVNRPLTNNVQITVEAERVQRLTDALNSVDTRVARQEHMPHKRIASGNHPDLKSY